METIDPNKYPAGAMFTPEMAKDADAIAWLCSRGWTCVRPGVNVNMPMWKRIRKDERLPCEAYLWGVAYEPNCGNFYGRLIPNIAGVQVGMDTWYLPAEDVKNLPKED